MTGKNYWLSTQLKRRNLLIATGALALTLLHKKERPLVAQPKFAAYPFTLGVASGEPQPDGVVLWTRLAPEPLNGGGMPSVDVPVQWQIAKDENMTQVVQSGEAIAPAKLAHSVHVEVSGLEPHQFYWYQFKVGNEISPVGRTSTAPAANAAVEHIAFAFTSCQDWQNGFYPAHQHLAQEDLDFVVFLGDYIYEDGVQEEAPRQHRGAECQTLDDYRNRYALYKTDLNLQAAHAAFPWIVTWDDHEVDNDYASLIPADRQSREEFKRRRADAYRAYYEHMPLRPRSLLHQKGLQLYRRFRFGDLVQLNVLDTRQYRTDQPCGGDLGPRCAEAYDQKATMMGSQQEKWLFDGLGKFSARWNVIAQQTMLAPFDLDPLPDSKAFNLDQWDGYVAERDRLLNFLQQQQPNNPIVITGDLHSSWVNHLQADFSRPDSAIVGTEFVSPAISSNFPLEYVPIIELAQTQNPHNQFFEGMAHGYVRCRLTRDRARFDYRVVSTILEPDASIDNLASFMITDGQPGVEMV